MFDNIYITKPDNYMILVPGEKFKMIVEDPTTKYTLQHL